MSVSVIVPTRNVEGTISLCLQSILAESPDDDVEIIVVDNGSKDGTIEIVRGYPVTLIEVPPAFVSRSRNVGGTAARSDILAFVDSDCTVLPGWISAIRASFREPDVGAAGARHLLRDNPTWVERAWYQRRHWQTSDRIRDVDYVPAGNLAVRRDTFALLGGFDESLETGEDPDLCKRIAARGLRVIENPAMRCVHLGEPQSLAEVFRRERWHGRGLRVRYGDGRLAPIAISTVVFLLTLLVSLSAPVLAYLRSESWPLYLCGAALMVPAIYAARYASPRRPIHFCLLVAVYVAYFGGRAAALPVVAARLLAGQADTRRRTRDR